MKNNYKKYINLLQMAFKVLVASYITEEYYKIPIDWDLEDVGIKWGKLYYKNEEVIVPMQEGEHDMKRPDDMEIRDMDEYEDFFDCEE